MPRILTIVFAKTLGRISTSLSVGNMPDFNVPGNQVTAAEAEKMGLVSKVFPPEQLVNEAVKLGEKIASNSQVAVTLAKEAVNSAFETSLTSGLKFEKRHFHGTFATADQKEGMAAFVEKRPPNFKNE